jgi:hypothetical protein
MIDEAMAQYGSLRVVETIEGEAAAESYRRNGYPGYYADQSGLGYLRLAGTGRDYPLDNLPPQASRTLSDGKGFLVWHMLAETLGRDDFRRILREFTARHAFQRVTWEDLLQAIQDGAGRDLQWFFAQWFRRTGAPEWHLTWRQDGDTVLGTITQAEPCYRATLEVRAEGDGGRSQARRVEVDGPTTEFTLPLTFTATSVLLDPRFRTLRWTPEYRAAVAQETRARSPTAAEQALLGEEERLLNAVVRGNRDAMRAQLADDFVQTDVRDWSRPIGRDAWIDNALRILGRIQAPEAKLEQTSVRVRGQAGIVQALFVLRGRTAGDAVRADRRVEHGLRSVAPRRAPHRQGGRRLTRPGACDRRALIGRHLEERRETQRPAHPSGNVRGPHSQPPTRPGR